MTRAASQITRPKKKGFARKLSCEHDVMTLKETAAYLRVSESEVARMAREQGLPGQQIGSDWRFLKSFVQSWLGASVPKQTNKAAILAMSGMFKDDPFLDEIVAEAYRQRGRPMLEES